MKDKIIDNLFMFLFIIFIILALIGIGFVIFVYVKYANVPVKDLPAWVLPFFNK